MLEYFAFWRDCQKYSISLWKCPQFLFIIMGIITTSAMVAVYLFGNYYDYGGPEFVLLAVFVSMLVVFVPGSIIVQSFEQMALADRMKGEFVGIASHQLRAPLTALKWSLGLLLNNRAGELKEEQKKYLSLMRKSNEQMIALVGDLLNVSRVEQKELALKKETVNVADLVDEKIIALKPTADAKKVELKFEKKESLSVSGDEIYLGMVVSNFIDNAIKYSKEKNGKVIIRLFSKDNLLRYEVQDNGRGIPKTEQKLIFTKFFRSSNVRKLKVEGTGLGLFIAKAIIEKLGGKIGFKSKEGEGTTFWFELPIIKIKQ